MIYFAAALACFALVGHIYVTRDREAKTRRQILELKESVARLTIAEQNRQSVRVVGGVSTSGFTVHVPKIDSADVEAAVERAKAQWKQALRP